MKHEIDYQRPEVDAHINNWRLVNDVVAGESAVKAKGALYLPKPNPVDNSKANSARYEQYKERAVFFNATGRTLEGMIGIALRNGPDVEAPSAMDFIKTDIDGSGGGITNQTHRVLEDVLKTGRDGLLVDYPAIDGAVSLADQKNKNIHAKIAVYTAENIINWRLDEHNNLSLVVLFEQVEVKNGYGMDLVDQWRELTIGRLSNEDEGASTRYIQRVWKKDQESGEFVIISEHEPRDAAGQTWQRIPFTFVGSVDNNHDVDKAPLLDLAGLNIAHYRNSADYEESAYFVGQPTFAFSGLDDQWMNDYWDEGVYVGSRSVIPLPAGGNATILAAPENTLAGKAMETKEKQMAALGARLLTQGEAIKTAEQSRSETAAAHSVLSLAVENVALAYQKALGWLAMFTKGATGEVLFTIKTDFTGLNADPNLLNAIVAAWQAGSIPTTDKNSAMRQIGMIDPHKSDQDIDDEIDAMGGGLALDE